MAPRISPWTFKRCLKTQPHSSADRLDVGGGEPPRASIAPHERSTRTDLRLSRAFRARRLGRLELLVDVLNALNDTAEEGIVTDALTTATIPRVPTFGIPNVFVDPRRAMVGMRIDLGRP